MKSRKVKSHLNYLTFDFVEITNDFRSKTFMEKIGFRNKRKEQKIFDLGAEKLHACREEL